LKNFLTTGREMAIYNFLRLNNTKKTPASRTNFVLIKPPSDDALDRITISRSLLRYKAQTAHNKRVCRNSDPFLSSGPATDQSTARASHRNLNTTNRFKRALDLIVASILLIVLSPLLLVLASLVRLSGPGPIIFRQKRLGAYRKEFVLFKFRTMSESSEFAQVTINDPRVTSIGRILRRLSFDEFVQLINVIRGEMSLVGPRPHAAETRVEGILFEDAVQGYQQRYAAKPGITGLAQVRGHRGETRTIQQLAERVESDLEYIENWSIWLDLFILYKTVPMILKPVNAY
jgi:lipopolysaccharide/colanic/teichoic acid biosynthesis glycosyltransferase